jgi:hypothetical protein
MKLMIKVLPRIWAKAGLEKIILKVFESDKRPNPPCTELEEGKTMFKSGGP